MSAALSFEGAFNYEPLSPIVMIMAIAPTLSEAGAMSYLFAALGKNTHNLNTSFLPQVVCLCLKLQNICFGLS